MNFEKWWIDVIVVNIKRALRRTSKQIIEFNKKLISMRQIQRHKLMFLDAGCNFIATMSISHSVKFTLMADTKRISQLIISSVGIFFEQLPFLGIYSWCSQKTNYSCRLSQPIHGANDQKTIWMFYENCEYTSSTSILCEMVNNKPMFAANEEIKLVLNWKTPGSIKWYGEVSETRALLLLSLSLALCVYLYRKRKHNCTWTFTMQPLFHP